jgi:hypothetical protein
VDRIIINVVVTIFYGMELQNESMADAILVNEVRMLTMSILYGAEYL